MTSGGRKVKPWPRLEVLISWYDEWALPLCVRWTWVAWMHYVYIVIGPFGLVLHWDETDAEEAP